MPLSDEQLAVIRSYVGNLATDGDLEDRYDRLGSEEEVIVETLRARLAVLVLDQPANISVPDGPTIGTAANIAALQKSLEDITRQGLNPAGSRSGTGVVKIYRPDYR